MLVEAHGIRLHKMRLLFCVLFFFISWVSFAQEPFQDDLQIQSDVQSFADEEQADTGNQVLHVTGGAVIYHVEESKNTGKHFEKELHKVHSHNVKRKSRRTAKPNSTKLPTSIHYAKSQLTRQSSTGVFKPHKGKIYQFTLPQQNLPRAKAIAGEKYFLLTFEEVTVVLFYVHPQYIIESFTTGNGIRGSPFI